MVSASSSAAARSTASRSSTREALQATHLPYSETTHPTTPGVRTQFYGLGWNVTTDDHGRVKLDHSGAFFLGAATNVSFLEGEQLGIVTLTNGSPLGIPEAINNAFFDAAQNGRPTVDWLEYYENTFRSLIAAVQQQGDEYNSHRPIRRRPSLMRRTSAATTTRTTARSP